jgi:uncharacterized protein YodC (DUF2158 family)
VDFQIGDVVILRSGGPAMTVRKIGNEAFGRRSIWCIWFDKTTKAQAAFDIEVLQKHLANDPA